MSTNVYLLQKQLEKIKKNQKANVMETVQYLFIRCKYINDRLTYYINDNVYNIIKENEIYKCILIIPATLKSNSRIHFESFSDVVKIISIHENYFIVQCQNNNEIKIKTCL